MKTPKIKHSMHEISKTNNYHQYNFVFSKTSNKLEFDTEAQFFYLYSDFDTIDQPLSCDLVKDISVAF